MSASKEKLELIVKDIRDEIFHNRGFEKLTENATNEVTKVMKFCEVLKVKKSKFDSMGKEEMPLNEYHFDFLYIKNSIKDKERGNKNVFDWEQAAQEEQNEENPENQYNLEDTQDDRNNTSKNCNNENSDKTNLNICKNHTSYYVRGLRLYEKFRQADSEAFQIINDISDGFQLQNFNNRFPPYIYELLNRDQEGQDIEDDLTDTEENNWYKKYNKQLEYLKANFYIGNKSLFELLVNICKIQFVKKEYSINDYKVINPLKRIDVLLLRPEFLENDDKLRVENREIKKFLLESFENFKLS